MHIMNNMVQYNQIEEELHHRVKRDLSWSDIETFYADKNNFAMYLVLPIIVLVYGGCAVIYCIARCRRYIRRKKKKSLIEQEETNDEPDAFTNEPTTSIPSIPVRGSNNGEHQMVPVIPTDRDGAQTSSEVRVSVHERQTPLPWQVMGDEGDTRVKGAMAAPHVIPKQRKQAADNKAFEHDHPHPTKDLSSNRPPSYEEMYKPVRPMSKPPPYEEKGISQRRGSVEEIITLETQTSRPQNERARAKPTERPSSRVSVRDTTDEDRERARQLVRGDRPIRDHPPPVDKPRQKTPDIISQTQTQTLPLKPQYKPVTQNSAVDHASMARQAAQLLRLDQMERQVGKKKKRLVFVAE
ncbi:hypothetical protein DPMN_138021 [Dreissena polymorpha]|uniref:Uncharacterized protein n=1 Tax=Dreissena polymorpha TaxID=45954 RepID=A0A9D4JE85_DREPO|nr:hypothetical protein DPMN_138021 [Dreissena polymorpha]